jgi:hypothetical protein
MVITTIVILAALTAFSPPPRPWQGWRQFLRDEWRQEQSLKDEER